MISLMWALKIHSQVAIKGHWQHSKKTNPHKLSYSGCHLKEIRIGDPGEGCGYLSEGDGVGIMYT